MTIQEKAEEYLSQFPNKNYGKFNEIALAAERGINEAYIAGMKEATRWIPIDESLPEHHPEMMLTDSADEMGLIHSHCQVLAKDKDDTISIVYRYSIHEEGDAHKYRWEDNVTPIHWRPIEFE